MGSYLLSDQSVGATFRNGQVEFDATTDWKSGSAPGWPEGTKLEVTPFLSPNSLAQTVGHVIIVGFGLAGRCVADLLDHTGYTYTIIERNSVTVETQRALGRDIREGNVLDAETLLEAGLNSADILALTIPDEEAVLTATSLARRLRPEVYIIARTNYSSKGMKASQLGANEVIKAEQAVALQFYDKLSRRIQQRS